jgi:hypothetical protein
MRESAVVRCGDEDQSARGGDRTANVGGAGFAHASSFEFFRNAKRHTPRDLTGVDIHRVEQTPRGLLTRPQIRIHETRELADRRGSAIGERATQRVGCICRLSRVRSNSRTHTPASDRKRHPTRLLLRVFRQQEGWCEAKRRIATRVRQLVKQLMQYFADSGVTVLSSSRGKRAPRQSEGLDGNRLCWPTFLSGNLGSRYGDFPDRV